MKPCPKCGYLISMAPGSVHCCPKLKEIPVVALPTDAKARKDAPMARGLLDYFPNACAAVAELSRIGNEQHNPGQPMHWAREKSTDHADCIVRHLVDRGTVDMDGVRHATKVAWRALALLQTELEAATLAALASEAGKEAPAAIVNRPDGQSSGDWSNPDNWP